MTDRRQRMIAEIVDEMSSARAAGRGQAFRHLIGKSISLTHLHVLTILRNRGPLPSSEVARALDVSAAGVTGIISRMEERGLVERRRDEGDRRVVTIVLASGGEAALGAIEGRGRAYFATLLGRLTTGELDHLRVGLRALGRAREEVGRDAGEDGQTAKGRSA